MLKKIVALGVMTGALLVLSGCGPKVEEAVTPPAAGGGGGGAPTGGAKANDKGPQMNPGQLPPPAEFKPPGGAPK